MLNRLLNFFSPYKNGAGYEPSSSKDIQIIIDLLNIKRGDKAIDLGSGDGRIVIALAKKGAKVLGVEKDSELVKKATNTIYKQNLENRASILYGDFWDVNLYQFNKIVIFQYHTVMERLENKILKEVQPGTLIVSHHWKFPHLEPVKKEKDIFLYSMRHILSVKKEQSRAR